MSCIDYSGLCFVVTPKDKSHGYRHRRNLVNSTGGWRARSSWVLGTLIYEGVTKRWKTDLNQPQYAYTTSPLPTPNQFMCPSSTLYQNKKLFVCSKIFGAASVPRPLPSLVAPMAIARNKTGAFYLIFMPLTISH